MSQKGGSQEAFAINLTGSGSALESGVNISTSVTDVGVDIQGGIAPGSVTTILEGKAAGQKGRAVGTQSQAVPRDTTSDIPNPLPTPINVDLLEATLVDHPDRSFVSNLLETLRKGANIGFSGIRAARFSRNLPTALAQPEVVKANLDKEVSLGRVAGPFSSIPFPNFQISPIGLVPKKYSDKFRTIFHLSFPKSGISSVNYSISKEDYSLSYITIDTAIEGIIASGHGSSMAKTDIDSAFRLIPLRPADYELFGMQWGNQYYFDKVLPFGLRSAPFIFNQLSDAVEWILINHCGISFVCHILDDFLIIEPHSDQKPSSVACKQSLTSMLLTFNNLGIPTANHKTVGPATTLEFMGIILDSDRMEARLPADKIQRLSSCFASFKGRKSCTLKELQSLIGSLNFACKVIPPGRPFLQRMIQLTRNVSKAHHHIKLSKGFFEDLKMWESFILDWNGSGFFLPSHWISSDVLSLYTDASGTLGFGGIFETHWFQGSWEPHHKLGQPGISIAWQELFAIVVACHLWANCFSNRRIRFFCDNESVVNIINTKRSHIPRVMDLVRHLTLLTLRFNFYIRAEHIEGKHNDVADSLSRFQMERFRKLAPQADREPSLVPPVLLQI